MVSRPSSRDAGQYDRCKAQRYRHSSSAQHGGEVLDHRTELTSISALVRATSQFLADDQDQLPVRVGPIRIGGA